MSNNKRKTVLKPRDDGSFELIQEDEAPAPSGVGGSVLRLFLIFLCFLAALYFLRVAATRESLSPQPQIQRWQ